MQITKLDQSKNRTTADKIITLANDSAQSPGGFLNRVLTRILIMRAGNTDNKQHILEVIHGMIDNYIENPANGFNARDRNQSSNIRGNILKEITNGQITWKVFIKGLRILDITKCEISFKLTTSDGKEINYTDAIVP